MHMHRAGPSSSFAAWLLGLCLLCALAMAPTHAETPTADKAQTVVHMLDYISVDYPEFVRDGRVLDQGEYAEQLEFATQSLTLLQQLPAQAGQAALLDKAQALRAAIAAKAEGKTVTAAANALRWEIIRAYQLSVAPRQAPDLAVGARLYAADCAACHGASGHGDGALAAGLDPAPSNFHDAARMNARSIYGLYNTITLGVAGTPMRPFPELSEAERWSLAFFVAGLRSTPEQQQVGATAWQQGIGKAQFKGFQDLVTLAPDEVAQRDGAQLVAVQAYLAAHPASVQAAAPTPLAITRGKLDASLEAYRRGDRDTARQLAIGAYLEGFELVEASLDNVDAPLRREVETQMMALRTTIAKGSPVAEVAAQIKHIEGLLDHAEQELSAGELSPLTAFLSALLILLREGLEAILVLAAILAFVRKTGRRDAMPYIHFGWIAAVLLGAATWVVSSYLLEISGANREVTEGITALIAAAMLLYVGYWLHSKSYAQAWNAFIRAKVNAALGKGTLWAMAGVAFLAVYRELFEIVLFYQTLWVQVGSEGQHYVIAGMLTAALLLALVAWLILKYSVRLPIGPFFTATSALLALLAVVFAGNGIAALQEAGVVGADTVSFVSIPLLGIHPTVQGLLAQALALALTAGGVWLARRQAVAAEHRAT
ncbi:FTR1 family protein [Rhodanobacter lindaniclasticus]